MKLARTGLGAQCKSNPKSSIDAQVSTVVDPVNMNQDNPGRGNSSYIFCSKNRIISECFNARTMSLEERKSILIKRHACFRCLRFGHLSRNCKTKVKCMQCERGYLTLMCPNQEVISLGASKEINVANNVLSNQSTI